MTKTTLTRSALAAFVTLIGGGACSTPRVGQTRAALDQTVIGTAQSFAVLGGSAVTNTGPSVVHGDLGVDPGLSVTGFLPGLVVGGIVHAGDAASLAAQNDVMSGFISLSGLAPTLDLTGQDLGGKTLTAGVYHFASSAQLTGQLILDAQGDPTSVFVFQIGSALTTASNASILVINGGVDCNVFFQVGSSATLGTTTAFKGNIIALASITLTTGVTLSGRALAHDGAVTLDTSDVSILSCAVPATTGGDAGLVDAGVPPSLDAPVVVPVDAPAADGEQDAPVVVPIDAAPDCAPDAAVVVVDAADVPCDAQY